MNIKSTSTLLGRQISGNFTYGRIFAIDRDMKYITRPAASMLSALAILFAFSYQAQAVYFNSGTSLLLPKGAPINESAFVAGQSLSIDSDVNGDLFCAGRDVIINGNIKGDVLCAGQNIIINGIVDGNVRTASQTLKIAGVVTRNISVVAQSLVLDRFSAVKGDIFFGGQQIDLGGSFGRDMAGAGEQITISGSLFRNATVTASKISLLETSKIGGDLDYYIEDTGVFTQATPKNVLGSVTKHLITREETQPAKQAVKDTTPTAMIIGKILSIVSFLLVAFLIIYFTPKRTSAIIEILKSHPYKSFFLGLTATIVAPIFLILMLITFVGMTSALVIFLVYVLSLIISSLYSSLLLGRIISTKLKINKHRSMYLDALIGCVVVGVLVSIPVLGWLFGLCLFFAGLGAQLVSYLPNK